MPNYVYNIIKTTADKKKLLDKIKEAGGICKYYMPMPEELQRTASPNNVVSDEEYAERLANGTTTEELHGGAYMKHYNSESQMKEFLEKHGATNWYDWANVKWGTKWGDFDWSVEIEGNGDALVLNYTTAWSPLGDEVMDMFLADIKNCEFVWEEEQGFGEKFSVTDGVAEFVHAWTEYDTQDE